MIVCFGLALWSCSNFSAPANWGLKHVPTNNREDGSRSDLGLHLPWYSPPRWRKPQRHWKLQCDSVADLMTRISSMQTILRWMGTKKWPACCFIYSHSAGNGGVTGFFFGCFGSKSGGNWSLLLISWTASWARPLEPWGSLWMEPLKQQQGRCHFHWWRRWRKCWRV